MARKNRQKSSGGGSARNRRGARSSSMVFGRRNYVLLLTGLAIIVAGYVIMRIDNQVDGFVSLYIAPLLLLGGYLEIIYAILYRPASEQSDES